MSYLERYLAGEREQLWDELVALGAAVREEPTYTDALAVARETMRRVRHNLEVVTSWLAELGFEFGAGFLNDVPPQDLEEVQRDAPILGSPLEDVNQQMAELEREMGPLPLSLRAFYEVVGSVNLIGRFPAGIFGQRQSADQWQGPQPLSKAALVNSGIEPELDPLFVWSLAMTRTMFDDWKQRRRQHGQAVLPYRLPIGPDAYFKYDMSGGGQYSVETPCLSADAPLLLEWHDTTFVTYLRICFRWGGFPGWERIEARPEGDLAFLTEGLLPL